MPSQELIQVGEDLWMTSEQINALQESLVDDEVVAFSTEEAMKLARAEEL